MSFEKVDGALGVVGGDDARGFSGPGLAAWSWLGEQVLQELLPHFFLQVLRTWWLQVLRRHEGR